MGPVTDRGAVYLAALVRVLAPDTPYPSMAFT